MTDPFRSGGFGSIGMGPFQTGGGGEWRWNECGCDYVVETTGKFVDRESCEKHMCAGAKKVTRQALPRWRMRSIVAGMSLM